MANPRILKVDGQVIASGVSDGASGSFIMGSSGSISGSVTIYNKTPIMFSGVDVQAYQYNVSRTDQTEMYSLTAVSTSNALPGGATPSYWVDGADILDPPFMIIAKTGRSGSAGAADVGQWFYSDVRIIPGLVSQDPVMGTQPKLLLSGTFEVSSGSAWKNAPNTYPKDLKLALGSTPNINSVGTDVFYYVSGTQGGKGTIGTSVFGGDIVTSGTLYVVNGITGSLTRLGGGISYLAEGSNITITTASNGQITIAGTNTQNTLDQSYDEGGSGVGAKITVDGQPIQLEVAGASSMALVVTGSVMFGSASDEYGGHLPVIGTDAYFYASGTIDGSTNKVVLGGDTFISGTVHLGDFTSQPTNHSVGTIWSRSDQNALQANFGNGDNNPRYILPHGFSIVRTLKEDISLGGVNDYIILMDATSGVVTCSLPPVSQASKKTYHIKKIDSTGNNVYIKPNGSDTIDGDGGKTINTQYTAMSIVASGSGWYIF